MYAAVGGVAAMAAASAHTLFGYNRDNFMYDRKMRQKQEFNVLKFRTMQADLWRDDVRTLIELTVGKMDAYTVVTALLFEFCGEFFGPGRLEPGTPQWLLWLYMLALSGGFVYLFLGIFFAMHASVAASAGSTRLLTQLVRLPVPSWYQLEGMRTYGHSVESLGVGSLLRVPFVSPLMQRRGPPGGRDVGEGVDPEAGAGSEDAGVDPWELETDGRHIYELQHRPTSELRHVDLVRRAAATWQSFEGFARVCMTMGVVQLLYAVAYYVIGYVLVEDGEVYGAVFIVVIMTSAITMLFRLDTSLIAEEFHVICALAFLGPLSASVAGYWWCKYEPLYSTLALMLLPVSFAAHGVLLAYVLQIINIQEQPNRTLLPMRWRAVLYMDVFGWLSQGPRQVEQGRNAPNGYEAVVKGAGSIYVTTGEPDVGSFCSEQQDPEDTDSRLAGDNEDEDSQDDGFVSRGPAESSSAVSSSAPKTSAIPNPSRLQRGAHPVSSQCAYPRPFGSTPHPLRPEDAGHGAPAGVCGSAKHSMSHCTKRESEHVEGIGPPGAVHAAHSEAFDADTYFPAHNVKSSKEEEDAVTGHDNFQGVAPWSVFRSITRLFVFLYLLGMFWCLGRLCGFPDFHLPPLPFKTKVLLNETHEMGSEDQNFQEQAEAAHKHMAGKDLEDDALQVHPRRLGELSPGQPVRVQWPRRLGSSPHAFSCDADGQHLVVADDFGVYAARLTEEPRSAANGSAVPAALFSQAPVCGQLDGQAPLDVSTTCASDQGTSHCSTMVLFSDELTVLAECPLHAESRGRRPADAAEPQSWQVAEGWLDEASGERIESMTVDSRCFRFGNGSAVFSPDALGCLLVSTSQGRLALLRRHASPGARELVPLWALPSPGGIASLRARRGSLHILKGGFAAILQPPRAAEPQDARSRRKRAAARAATAAVPEAQPHTLLVVDLGSGSVTGRWALQRGVEWKALSSGGGWLYALGKTAGAGRGDTAAGWEVWRFRLPRELQSK